MSVATLGVAIGLGCDRGTPLTTVLQALDDALTIDTTELEEADWFSREEVAAAMAGDEDGRFIAPPPHAIAHHLLHWWLTR